MNPSLASQADRYVEEHHDEFVKLGELLVGAFPPRDDKISSQVRNLQQIAVSATRFVDVEDFIKNQMGKERGSDRPWLRVGPKALEQMATLRTQQALKPGGTPREVAGDDVQLQYRLRLVRGWSRAVVSEYLYQVALKQMERSHG